MLKKIHGYPPHIERVETNKKLAFNFPEENGSASAGDKL